VWRTVTREASDGGRQPCCTPALWRRSHKYSKQRNSHTVPPYRSGYCLRYREAKCGCGRKEHPGVDSPQTSGRRNRNYACNTRTLCLRDLSAVVRIGCLLRLREQQTWWSRGGGSATTAWGGTGLSLCRPRGERVRMGERESSARKRRRRQAAGKQRASSGWGAP
jgi:hypothetical protein